MKIPISKPLVDLLIIPFTAVMFIALYDLYSVGQKRLEQNIALLVFFSIPALLTLWFSLDKRLKFKDNRKVLKAERLFVLPFSYLGCLFLFILSTLAMAGGLALMFGDNNLETGIPMLLSGLVVFVLTAIAHDHPKVWFSNDREFDEYMEQVKDIPIESYPAYQDGIFSYTENGFVAKFDNSAIEVLWADVKLIKAYKVDLLTTDSIVIEVHHKNTAFQVTDETDGHMKFMEIASSKLQGFKKDWWTVVAFPAFETNLTTVYERHN